MEPIVTFQHIQSPSPVFAALLGMFGILIALIVTAIVILIWCKLFSKAGYSWALGLLMLVPIANIIMPFVLAFSDWPIRRELRLLKQQQQQSNTPGQP